MTKAEQARLTAWRFKALQHAQHQARSVSRVCRHFGISRKTFYKWKKRYEAHGAAGLCDRSRAPLRSAGPVGRPPGWPSPNRETLR